MRISVVFGTRPEAIKLAPVIKALANNPDIKAHVCVTAQHRTMLDQVLNVFNIAPDTDLNLMSENQTLASFTAKAVSALDGYLTQYQPNLVLIQGDTTTAFCTALTSFYHKIPVGHVEAGLRTWNMRSPWPEEANRVLTSRLADLHFAPTVKAQDNLLKEGVPQDRIFVTGNTAIDALLMVVEKVRREQPAIPGLPNDSIKSLGDARMLLITAHRRENFGEGFQAICRAIKDLAQKYPDVQFVYPVHLNPNVQQPVREVLGKSKRNVHLIEPQEYTAFVSLMDRSTVILTDSGGIQEEAPSLGKPVLVMRDTTERPEAIEAGTAKLVGADYDGIMSNVSALLDDETARKAMTAVNNPYGDGKAAGRIVEACTSWLVRTHDPVSR